MFIQNTTPNQTATYFACNSPNTPISSTGSRRMIGRNTGMISSTIPTQSMNAPMNRKITIIVRMMPIVGRSAPTIRLAT